MIPDRDYYADKNGKLTDDPKDWAFQIGAKGVNLDDRIARRYGITDVLVSVDEPAAPRRVTGRNEASVKIVKADEKEAEEKESEDKPQEPADAAEPKAEANKPKAAAKKPAAKKEKTK